jgi:hypothetical protein
MPDVSTEVAIATTTLGSAASSIDFTSIGSGYTDLRVVLVLASQSVSSGGPRLTFNNQGSGLYSVTNLNGDGSSAASARSSNQDSIGFVQAAAPSTTLPSLFTIDVFSYAGSTFKTSLLTVANDKNGSGSVELNVGLFRSTTAISSLKLEVLSGYTWAAGTIATLYGIL